MPKQYLAYADVYRNGKLLFKHTTIVNQIITADNSDDALQDAIGTLIGGREFDYSYEDENEPKGNSVCLDYVEEDGTHVVEKYNNFSVEEVDFNADWPYFKPS